MKMKKNVKEDFFSAIFFVVQRYYKDGCQGKHAEAAEIQV
jgi:hypothetical protein